MSFLSHPSIQRAVAEEAETRDAAFLEAPADLCGVSVLPLTLRRYVLLCASNNAFVTGGTITPVEAARFLWCVSDKYNAAKVGLPEFIAQVAGLNYGEVLTGIGDYLSFAFFDAPQGGGTAPDVASYYSFAAVYLDIFGREYGWGLRDVMDCPLAVLFQLIKRIQQRNDPRGAILFNPLSDRAKAEVVREMGAA